MKVLVMLMGWNTDSLLKGITKMCNRLDMVTQVQKDKALHFDNLAFHMKRQSQVAYDEAMRSSSVAKKFRALIQ